MGERSLGKPDPFSNITPTSQSTSITSTLPNPTAASLNKQSGSGTGQGHDTIIPKPLAPGTGWATAWRQYIWDKWRWGVLIALAVVVSRSSSSG